MSKFDRLCDVYRHFAEGELSGLDFSDEMRREQLEVENGDRTP